MVPKEAAKVMLKILNKQITVKDLDDTYLDQLVLAVSEDSKHGSAIEI